VSVFFRGGLQPLFLHAPGHIRRALTVSCPVCREQPGQPCKIEDGKPVVHDARESVAFHGKKIWV